MRHQWFILAERVGEYDGSHHVLSQALSHFAPTRCLTLPPNRSYRSAAFTPSFVSLSIPHSSVIPFTVDSSPKEVPMFSLHRRRFNFRRFMLSSVLALSVVGLAASAIIAPATVTHAGDGDFSDPYSSVP